MLKWKTVFIFCGLGLLFTVFAFYNGYPLVTSDTGAYISNGFELSFPRDRLITYSLFLRGTSLQHTLWLPVILQGMLLAFLLYRLCRILIPDQPFSNLHFTVIVLSVTGLTAAGWYSGQAMPDVFTAFVVLSIMLYLFDQVRYGRWLYPLIIFLSMMMHNSNLLTLAVFSILLLGYAFWKYKPWIHKLIIIMSISVGSILAIGIAHVSSGYGFTISKSTHVFLIGKLCENGMLKVYLDRQCSMNNYSLCAYKDQLPHVAWDFIWDQNSPFYKTGGWDSTRTEYNHIIKDIIFSPRYWPGLIFKSAEHTFRQISQIQIGDGLYPYRENTNPYWKVQQYYGHELPEYMRSRQQMATLDVKPFNIVYTLTFLLSTMAVLLLMIRHPFSPEVKWIYLLLLLFVFVNAFVTANFANVLGRLSSRVIWLIPAVNLILLFRHFIFSKK
jgi:hypothetical protein